jgi:hypothetical protein
MKQSLYIGLMMGAMALYGVIFRLYTWFKLVDSDIWFRSDYMKAATLSVFGGAAAVAGLIFLVAYMYRQYIDTVEEYSIQIGNNIKKNKKLEKEKEQLIRDGQKLIDEIKKVKKDKGLPDEIKSKLEFFDQRQKDKKPSEKAHVIDPKELERKDQELKEAEEKLAKQKKEKEVQDLKDKVTRLEDDKKRRDIPTPYTSRPVPVGPQPAQQINIKQESGCSGCLKWFVIMSCASALFYLLLMLGFFSMFTR